MKEKLYLNDGQIFRLIWNEIRFIYDDFESFILRNKTNDNRSELEELHLFLSHLRRLSRSPFIILVWCVRGLMGIRSRFKLPELSSPAKRKHIGKMDIIIFSDARFDTRPRKTTYITRVLASKGHRVFFIEPNFFTDGSPYSLTKSDPNIFVINLRSTKEFDISFHKVSKGEIKKIKKSFNAFCKEIEFSKNTSILIGHPFWKKILSSCKYPKEIIPEDTGTDYNHFSPASVKTDTCAVGLCWIKQPVLGMLGGSDSNVDPKLLDTIATIFSTASVVIEGRIESKALLDIIKKHPNIFPVGEKPYHLLPKFLQTYHVCIMPATKGTSHSDSQEIYDYLSAGKATITSCKQHNKKIAKLIYVSKNELEFISNIKKALTEKGKKQIKKRQLFAASQTWERRVRKVEKILRRGLSM